MKNINLIVGGLCIFVNVICGLVLTSYSTFNCIVTSSVLALNVGLIHLITTMTLKDAYRISMYVLFPIMTLIEFVVGLFAPQQFEDNGFIIFLAVALLLEGIILVVTNGISKKSN